MLNMYTGGRILGSGAGKNIGVRGEEEAIMLLFRMFQCSVSYIYLLVLSSSYLICIPDPNSLVIQLIPS